MTTKENTNTVTIYDNSEAGFTCEICGDIQSLGVGYVAKRVFPLCNQCKHDLGAILKERRNLKDED